MTAASFGLEVFFNLHGEFGNVFRTHQVAEFSEILHEPPLVRSPCFGLVLGAKLIELESDIGQYLLRG